MRNAADGSSRSAKVKRKQKAPRPSTGEETKAAIKKVKEAKSNQEDDKRFAKVFSDPKFRSMGSKQTTVPIDSRFNAMFKDDAFKLNHSTDKRGRKVLSAKGSSGFDHLKRFYQLEEDDAEVEDEEKDTPQPSIGNIDVDEDGSPPIRKQKLKKKISRAEQSVSTPDEHQSDELDVNKAPSTQSTDSEPESEVDEPEVQIDLARGEGNLSSSDSDSDEEWRLEDDAAAQFDHNWAEMDKDAQPAQQTTSRLAVMNQDWDQTKARDILLTLKSFAPAGGKVVRVSIYPSEYGKQKMSEEAVHGPKDFLSKMDAEEANRDDVDDDEDSPAEELDDEQPAFKEEEEGKLTKVQTEQLREYQLQRLRYYYAVAECDAPGTADHIYAQVDGVELEDSATRLDLRVIPDGMTFDDAPVDVCCDETEDWSRYKATYSTNSALQLTSVKFSWDESDPRRHKAMKDAFERIDELLEKGIENDEIREYVASGSDSSDDEQNEQRKQAWQELLKTVRSQPDPKPVDDDGKEDDQTASHSHGDAVEEQIPEETETQTAPKQSPWDEYLEKRQEKRKKVRAEVKKKKKSRIDDSQADEEDDNANGGEDLPLLMAEEESGKQHYSLNALIKQAKLAENKNSKKGRRLAKSMKKKGAATDDAFAVDLGDERFTKLYESADFHIDPSASDYKPTLGTTAMIEEKMRRKHSGGQRRKAAKRTATQVSTEPAGATQDVDALVNAVKYKTAVAKKAKAK